MPNDLLLTCYNKGCGKKYDPDSNPNDACRYHSGDPFFHDAYKGWSCCSKKCTDFTEFLNIPGCTVAQHCNVKMPEKPKPIIPESNPDEVIEVKPVVTSTLQRPPIDTPMVVLKPELASSIKQQTNVSIKSATLPADVNENNIPVGTYCKNGGCNITYESPESNLTTCVYHPGCPIFHEGLKYWSCCQKRTSDFNAFLNQVGCERGEHLWLKKETDTKTTECRWDWHQTGNFVVLTVYAKQYCPEKSIIKLNPVRVYINLVFPAEDNSFNLDLELCGIVNVEQSQACMFGTKVEVKLRKAEPRSWSKLDIPKVSETDTEKTEEPTKVDKLTPQIDAVDLSDL